MKMKTKIKTLDETYTVLTCQLSKSPALAFTKLMTMLGDRKVGNEKDTSKDFVTMLFFNGKPALYPFGDLPGNKLQGVYQLYATEAEAKEGHLWFVARVIAILGEEVI